MNRLIFASLTTLPLVACYGGERYNTGECPAGEVCSDLTPRGLEFVGNSLVGSVLLTGPRATAIGGTQVVALQYERADGVSVALDHAYTADDDGGLGVRVESTSGSQVTVRGAGSRKNYLRILDVDGLLMDRKELAGAALERMELVSADYETVVDGTPLAFGTGRRELGVALYGAVQTSSGPRSERIIDTSMTLDLAGAQRVAWDALRIDALAGTYALAVTAGDRPSNTLDVVVVDAADTLAVIAPAPTTIAPNQSQSICFQAKAGARQIVGLTWTYDIDGTTRVQGDGHFNRNCVSVSTTKTSGTVAIEARAGGRTTAMALTVGASAREQLDHDLGAAPRPALRALPEAIPTAGDRAAM
jgi:hypothetical protein